MKKTESKALTNAAKLQKNGINRSTVARKKVKRYFWLLSKRIALKDTQGKTALQRFRLIYSCYFM